MRGRGGSRLCLCIEGVGSLDMGNLARELVDMTAMLGAY